MEREAGDLVVVKIQRPNYGTVQKQIRIQSTHLIVTEINFQGVNPINSGPNCCKNTCWKMIDFIME